MSAAGQLGKYQPYPEYKDSGVEWLGDVPNEWSVIAIKRLSRVKRGASPRPIDDPKYFDDQGTYSWVRISDVTASDVHLHTTEQTLSALGSSLSVKLHPGDLFLSIAATVGKPCIAAIDCCIHDGFVFFPDLKICTKFLYYLFSAGEAYKGLGKMGTQLNLNTDTVGDIKIGIGTNVEIENIVAFLDYETARIDKLIAKQQQLIELLKEKRQAVISHAVTKGLNPNAPMKDSGVEWLGEVPEHWTIPKLCLVTSKIGDGLHGTPIYEDGTGFYFVNGNNLDNGIISFRTTAKEVPHDEFQRHAVPLNSTSILMSINGTIGNLALYRDEPVILGKSAAYINCLPKMDRRYVLFYLRSDSINRYFDLELTGTTISNLSLNSIRQMKICVPPLDEQEQIVEYCELKLGKFKTLIDTALKIVDLMQERRTALISAAVTGKIDLRSWKPPQDEVAA